MFKPIVRANKNRKERMKCAAEEKAEEMGIKFTGDLAANKWASYSAEFISNDCDEPFNGWAVASIDNGDFEEEIDFVFGSGQMIFSDGRYVTTDEDYYETIGAGE